jgi:hypothetical protein
MGYGIFNFRFWENMSQLGARAEERLECYDRPNEPIDIRECYYCASLYPVLSPLWMGEQLCRRTRLLFKEEVVTRTYERFTG